MHITPDILETAYELLRATKPFNKWRLPDADDIEFRVTAARDRSGHFRGENIPGAGHEIAVSVNGIHDYGQMLETLAHECIHLRQYLRGSGSRNPHNQEFHRLAARVCDLHGFELTTFLALT